jgi:hypothetical protein
MTKIQRFNLAAILFLFITFIILLAMAHANTLFAAANAAVDFDQDYPECYECFKISRACKAEALNLETLEEMQKATVKCNTRKTECLKDRHCRNHE